MRRAVGRTAQTAPQALLSRRGGLLISNLRHREPMDSEIPARPSGSPLAHVASVLVERHRVRDPGVDFSSPASDLRTDASAASASGPCRHCESKFEREARALFGRKTKNRKHRRRATWLRSNSGQRLASRYGMSVICQSFELRPFVLRVSWGAFLRDRRMRPSGSLPDRIQQRWLLQVVD